jgi:phytanoyl-CoA hydroxylase
MSLDASATLASFQRDGYAVVREFFSGEQLDEFRSNVERFIRDVLPSLPRNHVFYENKDDQSTLKQFQGMNDHDEYFARWMNEGPFRELAELLLDGPVVPKDLQYFNKPPGIGKPTPAHQDGYYFMLDPCEALTIWVALDHVDDENGCVRYVTGSHKRGMRPHCRTQTLGFSQGITDYGELDTTNEVAFHASPGDVLVHDAMTIHRADGNQSANRTRRAIGIVYYSDRARVDEDAVLAYKKKLKREMEEAGQI